MLAHPNHKTHPTAAVVIPVYRSTPLEDEKIALDRCARVLGGHPIIFAAPHSLDLSSYDQPGWAVERFTDEYFAGLAGYNRLMLKPEFYERFNRFRYILIYQLDAFVFSDQLEAWCARGYDYIGAPWLDTFLYRVVFHISPWLLPRVLLRNGLRDPVGNGGFSLRRVAACTDALGKLERRANRWDINEDYFWSFYAPYKLGRFKIAPPADASAFALELNPASGLARNSGRLPFGCHGWGRSERDFWRPIFSREGYAI